MFEVALKDQIVLDDLYARAEADAIARYAPREWLIGIDPAATDALGGDVDADAVLAAAEHCQRQVNRAQAQQLLLACQWADLHGAAEHRNSRLEGLEELVYPGGDGTPPIAEFCPAELGAVMGMTRQQTRTLIADALDLRHRYPMLWRQTLSGAVKPWVARHVAVKTRTLSRGAAARVDERIAPLVDTVPFGRLVKFLDALILRADPDTAASAAQRAANEQGVRISRDLDNGYATLVGKAPAVDLQSVDASLDEIARALSALGDTDSHDVRRAKALCLLGTPSAVLDLIRQANEAPTGLSRPSRPCDLGPATLYVHLTDKSFGDDAATTVARVEGVGPVLLGQVQEWVGHRQVVVKPVLDIPGIRPVDCYEVPDRMADAIRLRTPASCFPQSSDLSRHGDNDHTTPYVDIDDGGPPGQTRTDNLGRLGRSEHRIKTHGKWHVTQPRNGCWLWRSPHGYWYLVDEHGTHTLGKLGPGDHSSASSSSDCTLST
jgi:hypothetical protein